MIRFKPGVTVRGVRPEIVLAITVAGYVFADHLLDCIVTSVTDGTHGYGSLHYVGAAVDFRTSHIPNENMIDSIVTALKEALGEDFDVVLEQTHCHVEFQPKKP